MNLPPHLAPWAAHFLAAGEAHGVDPLLLAAICDRETLGGSAPGYEPKGAAGLGDGGHGHGLMQIDDRAHPKFCASEDWKDPARNIDYAAQIVQANLLYFRLWADQEFFATAAYNAGPGRVREAIIGAVIDNPKISPFALRAAADRKTTAGKRGPYAQDVFRVRERLKLSNP